MEVEVLRGAVLARVRASYQALSPAERRVADLLEASAGRLLRLPIGSLAAEAGVSEATVVRFCRSVGYAGLRELKLELAGELRAPARVVHHSVDPADDTLTLITKVFRSDMQAIEDALATLDDAAVEAAVTLLWQAPRIVCYGSGSSVAVTQEAFYRFLRLGLPAAIETNWHMQATSAVHLPPDAVAFAVSRTGTTAQTLSALRWARRAGAKTVVLTTYRGRPVSALADVEIIAGASDDSIRPESIATRIAHLAVIDAISVALAMRDPARASAALLVDAEISREAEERE